MKQLKNFPWFSQLDNKRNPYGSCNVTSVAMCLYYFGIRGNKDGQLEDQAYKRMADKGWDHGDPYRMRDLVESYGCEDRFVQNGTLQQIRDAIDKGLPCIVHGFFTRVGHIVAIKGYDDRGFIVNDPYGEYFANGYDTQATGESLRYSIGLISRLCSPESTGQPQDIWLHTLSRGKK